MRSLTVRTVMALGVASILIGASFAWSPHVDAHHTTWHERWTFDMFMNQDYTLPGHPPGSLRPVTVCTDGLNGNAGAKTQFRAAAADWNLAAGFIAYFLYGSGELFGSCTGFERIAALWTTNSGACSGVNWVGCNEPTSRSAWGSVLGENIRINSGLTYSSAGLKAAMTHELGHGFGLWEQYDEPTGACGSQDSIMESSTKSGGIIISQCGATQTRPFDYTNVQTAFTRSFGTPPSPQVLWLQPINAAAVRLAFKVPSVGSYSYQRVVCGGFFPTSQPITIVNQDVAYADLPVPSSGTSVCNQLQVTGGVGSSGVHLGRLATWNGDAQGGWATIYSMSSQQAYMENNSGSVAIPYTRITDNVSYANYPQCPVDAALPALAIRYCNVESYGLGTVYWFSQDHVNYSALAVP